MYPKNQIVSCGIHFCGSAAFLVQYRFKDTGGSRDTQDTHGTRGRTKAHGPHRRTSQPSKPTNNTQPARQRDDRSRGRLTRAGRPGVEYRYRVHVM